MVVAKTEPNQFIAFLESSQDLEIAREAFKSVNLKNVEIIQGGVKEAITLFSQRTSPRYLIVDVSKSDLPVSDLSRLSEVCEPGVIVLAVGERNDVGLYRDLMRLGIFEYVVSPLFPEILTRAIKSMIFGEEKTKSGQSKTGKVISFVGSRGGVGTTFLSTNFAAILSKEKARRSVVLDLDLQFGTVPLYFDLKPSYGLRDVLENPDRIDNVFIERLLTPVNDRLFIIGSEEPLDEVMKYKTEGLEVLISYLAKQFHYVIIDVPHYSNAITRSVLGSSHILVLVTDSSLGGLRDSGRLISLFGGEGTGRRVIVVMNKMGNYVKNEVKVTDFEQALNHKINHVIDFDNFNPLDCINNAKTLVNQESALSGSIRKIVDDVIGARPMSDSKNIITNFLKMLKLK
ncbi:MAG: AAA family ATPase [Alphaproteobacteria bacterium]|nr:AAA family ATPase [Alphaproteobacteria bacterium]